jgi:hypothetical protein
MRESSKGMEMFEDFSPSMVMNTIISIPTHKRHNCRSTCIDNILTNSCKSAMLSGTLRDHKIGEHTPIFGVLNTELPKQKSKEKT